ncbi:putative molecular chaperone, partial [Tribonema minus]
MGSDRGPVDNQGYYDCLGVSKGADDNAIKKAYRRLAVKLHPDKEGGDPERFKELGEAYAVLSDPDKRRTYDQYGKAALDGSGGGSAPQSTDFAEDIFSALFGGGGGRRRGGAGGAGGGFRSAPRAPDATYELEVPLADLYSGATRRVRVWTQKVGGGGGAPVRAPKDVDIVIERGMRAGAAVVLKGEQDPGIPGIAPGDLVFVLREAPPDANGGGFTRVGDHLVVDVELTLAEALLGFCRPLCHLDGTTIKVRG